MQVTYQNALVAERARIALHARVNGAAHHERDLVDVDVDDDVDVTVPLVSALESSDTRLEDWYSQ